MAARQLTGWTSVQRRTAAGAVDSEQRVTVDAPVVEGSQHGARRLGGLYWAEVGRFGRGLFAVRDRGGGVDIRLLGRGPVLLALGPAAYEHRAGVTSATHPILGGLLLRRGGGSISFEQHAGEQVELRSLITGFHPRRGPFYSLVQRQLHLVVSRRYFRRLIDGAAT